MGPALTELNRMEHCISTKSVPAFVRNALSRRADLAFDLVSRKPVLP